MIKINLAKSRKSGASSLGSFDLAKLGSLFRAKESGFSSEGTGSAKSILLSKNSPLIKIAIAVVISWLVDDYFGEIKKEHLQVVTQEIAKLEQERSAVQAKLAKTKGYETVKKKLEEDELMVRTKLEVITKLIENRNGPSKMMMQVAQAIPEEVWLTGLNVTHDHIRFSGATPGYGQVSDFIKALGQTSQFGDITLSGIQENTSTQKDQRYQTFELSAVRKQAP